MTRTQTEKTNPRGQPRYGEESDGLVTTRDMTVPGAVCVTLAEEADHVMVRAWGMGRLLVS